MDRLDLCSYILLLWKFISNEPLDKVIFFYFH